MTRNSLWTVVGVVVAVVIAWFLVDVIFRLMWFVAKLGMVAIVALVVFLVIRMLFRRSED
ncbi:hypothetical protein [uncultured Microbacterium sp.]|uniref:Flagellar biosynthesis pathway, component FlhA n=1 Tax=uncultured Microbacterium sp. TaxID=191216 RepID=A0A1Y5NYW2_9MICO|nr:hypothetical protein [uncultured Microbacterium sp.]SBS71613.1 Flagellar biosynthesis pathway, component FlhA [uncultured Microbacterium sp.]